MSSQNIDFQKISDVEAGKTFKVLAEKHGISLEALYRICVFENSNYTSGVSKSDERAQMRSFVSPRIHFARRAIGAGYQS